MAIKKSDLYSSLWASCDELRGGMDASQYKDYVLFMLFIKPAPHLPPRARRVKEERGESADGKFTSQTPRDVLCCGA